MQGNTDLRAGIATDEDRGSGGPTGVQMLYTTVKFLALILNEMGGF